MEQNACVAFTCPVFCIAASCAAYLNRARNSALHRADKARASRRHHTLAGAARMEAAQLPWPQVATAVEQMAGGGFSLGGGGAGPGLCLCRRTL